VHQSRKQLELQTKTVQKLQNVSQAVESLPKQSRSFQKLLERFKGFQIAFN